MTDHPLRDPIAYRQMFGPQSLPEWFEECREHNFIRITKSTHRKPPYMLCSKCGLQKEECGEAT